MSLSAPTGVTVPKSTLDDYTELKASGNTTFKLNLRAAWDEESSEESREVYLQISGTDKTSKDGYRTCVIENTDTDNDEYAALIHALTGNDGKLKWVLLIWTNTSTRVDGTRPNWPSLGPWVAEQLGGIAKVISHTSVEFADADTYSARVAPELADL